MLCNDRKATSFAISDRKLFVPIVILSTQDKAKLLTQLKSVKIRQREV